MAWAYNDRGDAYTDNKNYDAAIAAYSIGIGLDHDDTFGYSGRCIAHAWKSEWDAVIKDCTQAIRLKPDFAVALCWRGIAERASGQTSAGDVDIAEARKIDSGISCPSNWRP
ncbi:MAG: tetratricopeptide repeat protein [Beijerinckiaceae bacterium]